MRIVILGDGLLGSDVVKQTGWEYLSRKKDGFDLTQAEKFDQYFVENYHGDAFAAKYDCIVNCIAYTNTYSPNKQLNWDVNYKGVADLVDFCNKWKIKLILISTDYVYTNSTSEASENDIPIHGNNWYSYTKLLADAYIELRSNNYLICRETHKPNPFPYESAWTDIHTNCDSADVIADLVVQLVELNANGVYNVGTEVQSIYDLAKRSNPDIKAINKPAHVPNDISMNVDKLNKKIKNNK
jgi:dTDP-4-dehydrorhamnose reductase